MHVTAIIAAGGRGQRLGAAEPKQLIVLGGRTLLERSVDAFLSHPAVNEVVVALPPELVDNPPDYLRPHEDVAASSKPLRVVAGGARRQDSVANGFRAASAQSEIIVIHDAARPFVSANLIARTIAAAVDSGAALPAIQARDTVKQATLVLRQAHDEREPTPLTLSSSKGELVVLQTLPRESIFLAQTPQAFRRSVLADALKLADEVTDEAALAERAGHRVRLISGEASNIKITTPEDLPLAEAIAEATDRSAKALALGETGTGFALRGSSSGREAVAAEFSEREWASLGSSEREAAAARSSEREGFSRAKGPARTGRAGTGYDLHRLVAGRPLILGGVTIPSDVGALGHSDADVVCHAITDAILGAAGLGDIGHHFPDSDPRWKDASSTDLLARAVQMIAGQGFEVGNVDVTVVLEKPKIRDHVDAMRQSIANVLSIDAARVSIKAKTNEGMDAVGRGEAIAAHAVALIRAISH
jgi:2-C-methyl-D-erythritol 4-phosphate cytidylyltransferase / 2-C-methyl-D-erythritol 2,4-cyclodiphosphate synthase